MRPLSLIVSLSIIISLVCAAEASNEHQAIDILPVSYKSNKRSSLLARRDYATTLRYLRAAMASYRKDAVTPPSAEFAQLEQSLAPLTEPMPLAAEQQFIPSPPPPPPAPEQQQNKPQHLDASEPLVPDLNTPPSPPPEAQEPIVTQPNTPELGSKNTEKKIPNADIEEDDTFDPEEDPDDVDDPPVVNGIPVDREE